MKKRLLVVLILVLLAPAVWAQGCAMCTKTASELDSKSAKGLNAGILYLAALPLTIIGTVGFIWWKHNR
jgi:hypothetical protein